MALSCNALSSLSLATRAPSRTRYTLWAWEHLKAPTRKGAPMLITPELLTFVQPGGKGERVTTHVPGVVSLDEGDEVIVLLASTPWGLSLSAVRWGSSLSAQAAKCREPGPVIHRALLGPCAAPPPSSRRA